MRGNAELSAWGAEALASAHVRRSSARSTSAPCSPRCAGTRSASSRCRPASISTSGRPSPATWRSPRCRRGERATLPNPGNAEERLPDEGNAERVSSAFSAPSLPVVVYFGKLIEQKGVHVLIDALAGIEARLVVVGFGPERTTLERRAADRGVEALFTGPLEHRHLRHLLALADACVVPSIFPEAFGMVAAEAASAGCPPLVARHSGLAEVAAGLEDAYPPALRHLAAFESGDADDLARRLGSSSTLPPADRAAIRAAARAAVVERWSWAGVSRRLLEPFA